MPPQEKPEPRSVIFVVGFMASGKTRLAQYLAEHLGWKHHDTDAEIERRAGCTIAEIFDRRGEAAFRELEHQAIADAADEVHTVVSVGGGAVLAQANIDLMRERGVVLYRETPFEILFERAERKVAKRQRPLWAGTTPEERRQRMSVLFEARRPHYREAAHLTVETGEDGTAQEAAAAALKRLRDEGWLK